MLSQTFHTRGGNKKKSFKNDKLSGLIPGWDAARKKRTSVNDDEQSDDGNFRYGGIVPDNETDEIEARAVKNKMVKKPEDDKITVIKPNPLAPKKIVEVRQGAKHWSIKHLPNEAQDAWDPEVAPRLRLKAGNSADPWNFPRMSEVQDIIDEVYGKEKYKIVETGAFYGLAQVRVQNWRRSFFEGAKKTITDLVQHHKEKLQPGETILDFIDYYQSKTTDGETCVYQWKSVNPVTSKKKGFLAADMIMKTLGLAHMAKLPEVLCNFGAERPIGALVLATQAIDHILEQWKTGEFVPSNKEFSAVNYANKEVFATPVMDPVQKQKTVKKTITHHTTMFFDAMESFTPERWNMIINNAREYVPEKRTTKKLKREIQLPDDIIIIEDESCNFRRPRFVAKDDSESGDD
ncbi:hypothetical protein JOM56_013291 [Amanita muscaria]